MSRSIEKNAYLILHIAVILYGFTGILGRLIELPAIVIVWYRMLITLFSLCAFPLVFRKVRAITARERWKIAGIGVLIALHWVSFYGAIKYSNVSITLSCLASTSFFTAILEPIIFKQKIKRYELVLGAMVVAGFLLVFGFSGQQYLLGIWVAILSAVLAAIFSILNKGQVMKHDAIAISLIEFVAGFAFLSIVMPAIFLQDPSLKFVPSPTDWIYILILALLCTTLAFVLTMLALKRVSAFNANLAINLEPVYAMVMAYFIFQENQELNAGVYAGSLIIIFSVFIYPSLKKKMEPHARAPLESSNSSTL